MGKVENRYQEKAAEPVIVLPEERRIQLTKKLTEYRERLGGENSTEHPDLFILAGSDAAYKIAVLGRLLEKGSINTYDLSLEMKEKFDNFFDGNLFNNACGVINSYCKTGGLDLHGGTGLSPNVTNT